MPAIISLKDQLKKFEQECFAGPQAQKILAQYNTCVNQTKDFIADCPSDHVVIGLSGGIDSALVACIAVDAVGKNNVHAVILPGPYSSQASINDAKELADNLDIDTHTIFINSAYDSVVASLNESKFGKEQNSMQDLTQQNIQARLRMLYIMAFSNEYGWIMLNTSNKTEVYTGYSTLYGDMAGAFAPIGDVYKCDVFKMSIAKNLQMQRMLNYDKKVIPQNIINKSPSAELTENQTDESSLGIDYPTLDEIIKQYVDQNKTEQEIIFSGINVIDVQSVVSKIKKSAYKRPYEPPNAKV